MHALFHPDYTVGSGIAPDLLTLPRKALAGSGMSPDTAGGELHPALRTLWIYEGFARVCKANMAKRFSPVFEPS